MPATRRARWPHPRRTVRCSSRSTARPSASAPVTTCTHNAPMRHSVTQRCSDATQRCGGSSVCQRSAHRRWRCRGNTRDLPAKDVTCATQRAIHMSRDAQRKRGEFGSRAPTVTVDLDDVRQLLLRRAARRVEPFIPHPPAARARSRLRGTRGHNEHAGGGGRVVRGESMASCLLISSQLLLWARPELFRVPS
jgi:hypothetical protein